MGILDRLAERHLSGKIRRWTGHDLKGAGLNSALECVEVFQIVSRQYEVSKRNSIVQNLTEALLYEAGQFEEGLEVGLGAFAIYYRALAPRIGEGYAKSLEVNPRDVRPLLYGEKP